MSKIIPGLLLSMACALAHAQVYKWVDAHGVTHYDQKPPENVKSKEVPIRSGTTTSTQSPADLDDLKNKDAAFRKRQAKREEDEAKAEHDREELQKKCAYMTGRLAEMEKSRRMYNTDANGERVYLTDDQRAAQLAKNEQEYNQNCK